MIITLIGGTRHGQKRDVTPDVTTLDLPAPTLENPLASERYQQREWIEVGAGPQQVSANCTSS